MGSDWRYGSYGSVGEKSLSEAQRFDVRWSGESCENDPWDRYFQRASASSSDAPARHWYVHQWEGADSQAWKTHDWHASSSVDIFYGIDVGGDGFPCDEYTPGKVSPSKHKTQCSGACCGCWGPRGSSPKVHRGIQPLSGWGFTTISKIDGSWIGNRGDSYEVIAKEWRCVKTSACGASITYHLTWNSDYSAIFWGDRFYLPAAGLECSGPASWHRVAEQAGKKQWHFVWQRPVSTSIDVKITVGSNTVSPFIDSESASKKGLRVSLCARVRDFKANEVPIRVSFQDWPLPCLRTPLLNGLYTLNTNGSMVGLHVALKGCWCAASCLAVTAGVDVDTSELRHLKPGDLCQQAGRAVILKDVGDEGAIYLLCAPVVPKGWVRLAEWADSGMSAHDVNSAFCAPDGVLDDGYGWKRIKEEAFHLDSLCRRSQASCAKLAKLQTDLRALVQRILSEADPSCTTLIGSSYANDRDQARCTALEHLREYIECANASLVLTEAWMGAGGREYQVRGAQARLDEIKQGACLDATVEMSELGVLKSAARRARTVARSAETELINARELDSSDAEVLSLEVALDEAREATRKADRSFQKKMSRLSGLAGEHLPELLLDILTHAKEHVRKELMRLKEVDQTRVLKTFAMQRSLSQYDQHFEDMEKLTKGSRHCILGTTYKRKSCVLKVFDFRSHGNLASFLREVALHGKLDNPLIVPLCSAFLDVDCTGVGIGILHFNRYLCDMDVWGTRYASDETNPELAVLRHARTMTHSVSYIHSLGIVHGDLKPSNWLYDVAASMPRLCDFETAKDRGNDGMTGTVSRSTSLGLRTPGWVAPELLIDPLRPKSRASDVFALGLSIQYLLECVASFVKRDEAEPSLGTLVEKMKRTEPSERVTATESLHDEVFSIGKRLPSLAAHSAFPVYWTRRGTYEWHRSQFMEKEVTRLMKATMCRWCSSHIDDLVEQVINLKVLRVENLILWKGFSSRRAELLERNGSVTRDVERSLRVAEARLDDTVNEVFLWHGLSAVNVPLVANSGLDERVANTKAPYGAGIYLTSEWCEALQHTRVRTCNVHNTMCGSVRRCMCEGPKRMLLCRALLGEPYYVKPGDRLKGFRRPPPRCDAGPGIVHDCIIAEASVANNGAQRHSEFVLFDRRSVYPEWIVEWDWR